MGEEDKNRESERTPISAMLAGIQHRWESQLSPRIFYLPFSNNITARTIFELCISIIKSSENCYHVVFNRGVSWSENMRIVAWVSLLSHNRGLLRWFVMQCIKESSTLMVSRFKYCLSIVQA